MGRAIHPAIEDATIYRSPCVFPDKKGLPVMVRAFEPRLLPELTAMYLAYAPRGSIGGVPPVSDIQCAAWVRRITSGTFSLIALSFQGEPIGHAVLFPMRKKTCELLIVIAPPFQKSGIGTHMMRAVLQLGFEMGFSRIWISVHRTNFVALHLYNKCGFECLSFTDSPQIEMELDLRRCHPTASVRVAEAMNPNALTVRPSATIRSAVELFLRHGGAEVLPVVGESGIMVGIVSETDLMFRHNLDRPVGEIATRDVVSLRAGATLDSAIRLLQRRNLRSLPVVDGKGRVAGIVSRRDILAHYFRSSAPGQPRGSQA